MSAVEVMDGGHSLTTSRSREAMIDPNGSLMESLVILWKKHNIAITRLMCAGCIL